MIYFRTSLSRAKSLPHRGFTLTELAIVLGVIGTILSAIWVASAKVNEANKTQRAAAQMIQILNGYRSLYAARGIDTTGCWAANDDATCLGITNGLFPSDMGGSCSSGGTTTYPKNPYGGIVYIQSCQDYNSVLVGYTGLSQAECNSLANTIYSGDLTYQSINNGTGGGGNCATGWSCQFVHPYQNNALWTATDIDAACGANHNNVVQIGVSVK